ncbi:hypothetical protein THOB06_10510 [Vibrio rotiferianus]|nr:hypothetical protein THOG10_10508 [Vibrio rotiferianus]CAH1558359.1 hypothetical protein THOB06_10510 [Vibrio rotiferianus]
MRDTVPPTSSDPATSDLSLIMAMRAIAIHLAAQSTKGKSAVLQS